jgi:SAM-dependent methyltransferase
MSVATPLGLERSVVRTVIACPKCKGELTNTLECASCGSAFANLEGRPVLLRDGTLPSAKRNAVIEHQAAVRSGTRRRSGVRGWADAVREVTSAGIFGDDATQVRLLVDKVKPLLDPIGDRRPVVLDVGACEQYYREELLRLGDVIAMDISVYGPTDIIGDCHALPLRDRSVDVICAVEVLEHLRHPAVFFGEAVRVLRPGGILLGVTPQYCPTHGFPYDFFRYTQAGLTALAEDAGLKHVETWPIGGPWGTLLHWYWANHAREHWLRKVPVLNIGYHLWFQLIAVTLDRLDARSQFGQRLPPREHRDHLGWSFVFQR